MKGKLFHLIFLLSIYLLPSACSKSSKIGSRQPEKQNTGPGPIAPVCTEGQTKEADCIDTYGFGKKTSTCTDNKWTEGSCVLICQADVDGYGYSKPCASPPGTAGKMQYRSCQEGGQWGPWSICTTEVACEPDKIWDSGEDKCRYPMSCLEIKKHKPDAVDGTYKIDVYGENTLADFQCDMTTGGGGWTGVTRAQAATLLKGSAVENLKAVKPACTEKFNKDTGEIVTKNHSPCTNEGHLYHNTFDVPFGYKKFFLSHYKSKAESEIKKDGNWPDVAFVWPLIYDTETCQSDYPKPYPGADDSEEWKACQSIHREFDWTSQFKVAPANIVPVGGGEDRAAGTGDIMFGTVSTPLTSFAKIVTADQYGSLPNYRCATCENEWPANENIFQHNEGPAVYQFRIGWGGINQQHHEGWMPWASGMIFFR